MKTSAKLLAVLVGLNVTAVAQNGIVIHKDAPWDRDQFARVTPYKKVEKFPTVHNVEPLSGKSIRINSSLVLSEVEFPKPATLANLTSEAELEPVEAIIKSWTATLKRFPQSAKILKPRLDALLADVAQFRSGKVKSEGVWMTPDALAAKRKLQEEERARIAARLEAEARAMEIAAAEGAERDAQGRVLDRMARTKAQQDAITADEQKRLDAYIRESQEKAAKRAMMKPAERLATDEWVTPPEFKEEKAKDYVETLKTANTELSKRRLRLGFGRESQKLVLVTPHVVVAFPPKMMSPEVIEETLTAEGKQEIKDAPSRLLLASASGKEVVEVFGPTDTKPEPSATVIVAISQEMDSEKLKASLSHLIELCGGKPAEKGTETKEIEATPDPAASDKPA